MSLTENGNQLFLPGWCNKLAIIAHISQFGPTLLEVFKAAQSKISHILTRPISTSVERMGLGQACDSKRLNDCKRQGADQPSTRAGWPVPLLFTNVSVENYGFSNIL